MSDAIKPLAGDPLELLRKLHRWGYFYAPEVVQLGSIEYDDLPSIDLKHPLAIRACAAYQEWFRESSEPLAQAVYGRLIEPDGEAGLLTERIAEEPRCGFPDYPHPSKGYLSPEGECLLPAEVPAQANWPDSCRRELTKAMVGDWNMPGGIDRDKWEEWERFGSKNITDVFDVMIKIDHSQGQNASRWIIKANLGGSILADQFLAISRCAASLRGRYDVRNWSERLAKTTITHEELHFWGLPHSRNPAATIYPSITNTSMARFGALHEADIAMMLERGYKRRTKPDPDPDPDPNVPNVKQMDGLRLAVIGEDGVSHWHSYKLVEV